jgi:hypothetical protein
MLETARDFQPRWNTYAEPVESLREIVRAVDDATRGRARSLLVSQRGTWFCVDLRLSEEVGPAEAARLFAQLSEVAAPFDARLRFDGGWAGGAHISLAIPCRIEP